MAEEQRGKREGKEKRVVLEVLVYSEEWQELDEAH